MPTFAPTPDTSLTKAVVLSCNLAQAAATYDAGTVAGGSVLVVSIQPFVSVAAGGLTSVVVNSDNTTADAVLTVVLLAALTGGKNLTALVTPFVLPVGKKIQYTIVGVGNAGTLQLAVRYQPLTSGAVLA